MGEMNNDNEGGRAGIGDPKRRSFSRRAMNGNLTVVRVKCPYCGHHKALQSINIRKCAKCKRYF